MGLGDKFDAAKDKIKGKADEAIGKATDDDSRVVQGKAEQASGGIKDTVADAKAHLREDTENAEDRMDDTEGGSRI
ncbi:CsbD family protein [Arthrobacter mobilis]|uniref:CsbD family protein n=1 Tax=Arthrobacter mobilis TaxID=2724944 RepID=A0A7X6HGN5_9MICC|nr:CsbD family protein [Arthrobacter mobilis]NKX55818.1 CsbD family protein [Arthrobacter mobilis]